jgi:hypothetical protein
LRPGDQPYAISVVNNLQIRRQPGLPELAPQCRLLAVLRNARHRFCRFIALLPKKFILPGSKYARAFLGPGKNPVI